MLHVEIVVLALFFPSLQIVFVGFLLGGLVWGVCADVLGRKYVSFFTMFR